MTQPETKTVLGRVFTWDGFGYVGWLCKVSRGHVLLEQKLSPSWEPLQEWKASFIPEDGQLGWSLVSCAPTESDAILALQSTLRKMAELEVAE